MRLPSCFPIKRLLLLFFLSVLLISEFIGAVLQSASASGGKPVSITGQQNSSKEEGERTDPTEKELFRFDDSRVSMACTYTVVVYGTDSKQLPLIVNAAFEEIDRIDQLMSNYNPDSPLSQINREADKHPVIVEPELFDFIQLCLKYSRESDGAFDITVGPLMKSWGFYRGEGRIPWFFELWTVMRKIGFQHLILDPHDRTIQFNVSGMELDLGGIAKGYAVDRVIGLLKEYGIQTGFVSAGGSTVYGLGAPPNRDGWEIRIRDPLAPNDAGRNGGTVHLKNRCLSVAGNYEKFFKVRGTTYSHIMDPHTGYPVQGMLSVTVLTDSGVEGDAIDDVLYVLGVEKSKAYLEKHLGIEAFFYLPDGDKQWKMVNLKD
jgi:thiamine biosynthesis lipoprotein